MVQVGPGTYVEAINFGGKAITVESTDGAGSTQINPGGTTDYAVTFDGLEEEESVLDGFTIRNTGEQGILCDRSSPTLLNLSLTALGSSTVSGGAMYLTSAAPIMDGLTFSSNQAEYGGHIFMDDLSAPEISNSSFSNGNATQQGGAIYLDSASYVAISDSTFDANAAVYRGGALAGADFSVFELTDVDLSDNTTGTVSGNYGGALYTSNYAEVYLTRTTWTENSCGGGADSSYSEYGGALYMGTYGVLEATDTSFTDNECRYGGAVYTGNYTSSTWDGVELSGNAAYYYGGAYAA